MRIGAGLLLIAVGAILRGAVGLPRGDAGRRGTADPQVPTDGPYEDEYRR